MRVSKKIQKDISRRIHDKAEKFKAKLHGLDTHRTADIYLRDLETDIYISVLLALGALEE